MKRKLSTKAMFVDICSQRSRLEGLRTELKKYSILVEFIIANNFYYNDEYPYPSVKEMQDLLGLSHAKLRSYVQNVYEILLDYKTNKNHPFVLKKNKISFHIDINDGNSVVFKIEGLDFIPRKGESVTVPFFNSYSRISSFYVYDVETKIFDDGYEICVFLKMGLYNSYWEIRKDQAFATNEISIMDGIVRDYELERRLNISPTNAW